MIRTCEDCGTTWQSLVSKRCHDGVRRCLPCAKVARDKKNKVKAEVK